MNDLNRYACTGRLTRDPQQRYTPGGTSVCDFGIAVNRKYKEQDQTCFIDVTCWSGLADIVAQYATKGRQVAVSGRLALEQWEDKQTGVKRSRHKIVADEVVFIGPKPVGQQQRQEPASQEPAGDYGAEPQGDFDNGSEVPF